jgi:hypothetical protein
MRKFRQILDNISLTIKYTTKKIPFVAKSNVHFRLKGTRRWIQFSGSQIQSIIIHPSIDVHIRKNQRKSASTRMCPKVNNYILVIINYSH